MKNFISILRLKLALILAGVTRKIYYWSLTTTIMERNEQNPMPYPQIPEKDIEWAKEMVLSYFNHLWEECFTCRISRIHRGKIRYDTMIVTPKRDTNTRKRFPKAQDAYIIRFIRSKDEGNTLSREIEMKI